MFEDIMYYVIYGCCMIIMITVTIFIMAILVTYVKDLIKDIKEHN